MKIARRQVATSTAILLAENSVRLFVVAGVSFLIARQFGPAKFGVLNFASAVAAMFVAMASLGMDTPLIFRLSGTSNGGVLMGSALLLRTAAGIGLYGVAVLCVILLKGNDRLAIGATAIASASVVFSSPSVFDYWFKARTLATWPALSRIAGTSVSATAKIACLVAGLGVIALACTVALESLVAGAMVAWAYVKVSRARHEGPLAVSLPAVRSLARECAPFLLSTIATIIYMKVDIVMLGYFRSDAEVGVYALAQKLSEVLYIVPVVIIESVYPALVQRQQALVPGQDETRHGQMLFDLSSAGAILVTPVAVAAIAPVIHGVFGESYDPSIDLFQIHAWSCIAVALSLARHRWFAVVGLQRFAPLVTSLGAVTNIVINLLLIPAYGPKGAAVATVVSYFGSGYLCSYLFPALRQLGRMQTLSLWPWARLILTGRGMVSSQGRA